MRLVETGVSECPLIVPIEEASTTPVVRFCVNAEGRIVVDSRLLCVGHGVSYESLELAIGEVERQIRIEYDMLGKVLAGGKTPMTNAAQADADLIFRQVFATSSARLHYYEHLLTLGFIPYLAFPHKREPRERVLLIPPVTSANRFTARNSGAVLTLLPSYAELSGENQSHGVRYWPIITDSLPGLPSGLYYGGGFLVGDIGFLNDIFAQIHSLE